ncbi:MULTISPECIES: hypothetical protein [unclassified Roseitalea]|uniref:hypothetical protein n=1 Tax=unclassified Roseitalea TaxID=2639107 RepID=UPI00273F74E0|nr:MULTISPECIES: hypothetical protein [unclassified Roseitalea]
MFMRYAMQRRVWRRSRIVSDIALVGGFGFATLVALFSLTTLAPAAPLGVDALATMLAAPELHAGPSEPGRQTTLAAMLTGLAAMGFGALTLTRGLLDDFDKAMRRRG